MNYLVKVIAGMTITLDGFVAGPSGSAEALCTDFIFMHGEVPLNGAVQANSAVVIGRKAFSKVDLQMPFSPRRA